ncbi:aldehyde dehydrogenase 5, mitochondrial [[Candida] jaroonii]|uniref:Aldehyde dehydrogenase 5, mitochondrial n=1 Tax=[Candida] jaroonii TaxID=467808 RepID=A0ACA9Y102_9ASCO|nr:aldehyde dehydrogenase 5, mitochondrial [[Candida] jaroonii]
MASVIDCIVNFQVATKASYILASNDEIGSSLYEVKCISEQHKSVIDKICDESTKGFKYWSQLKFQERIDILQKVCLEVERCKDELIESMEETGMPRWFCEFNAGSISTHLSEYIRQISRSNGKVVQSEQTDLAMVVKTPVGPVLAISPWNAPGVLTGRTISAPLASGCSVIIKSNELSVKTTELIVKCFHNGGVPVNVLQMVNVLPEDNKFVVEQFIKHKSVRKISFTGSTQVGSSIASTAGKYLKPCILELGGKNCTIIEPDADLEKAIETSLFTSWGHKGQICMSTDKIFIHESIYEEALEKFVNIGKEFIKNPDFKILQRTGIFTRKTKSLIDDALKKGGKILLGEYNPIVQNVNFELTPLLLGEIPESAEINDTEIFGAVACLYKYKDINELIEKVNDDDYGLKTSLWSKNTIKAYKLASLIESGGVHINSGTIFDESTSPHGGVKSSGYGRFNSSWGIDEFCFDKIVTMCE